MADNGKQEEAIEADSSGAEAGGKKKSSLKFWKKGEQGAKTKKERPSDAVKLGCGGLFRRKKKSRDAEKDTEPVEKPHKNKTVKGGTVKEEQEALPAIAEGKAAGVKETPPVAGAAAATLAAEAPDHRLEEADPGHKAIDEDNAIPSIDTLPIGSPDAAAEVTAKSAMESTDSAWVRPPIRPPNPPRPERPRTPLAELARKASQPSANREAAAPTRPDQSNAEAVENGKNEENDEEETKDEEKERHRLAELRFQQGSVDIASVPAKPGVKIEQGPHADMWSNIVNKSFVGTGMFKKAAVCSLETGGLMACNPADFTPTVEQAATLRDNFNSRGVFSAAGFGVADTIFQLQEESATKDVLCGADEAQTQAVMVFRTNTALVMAVCTDRLDRALEMLSDMREHFISQGM